jgi:ElaB/YqjD/DUF883 family membrane-anchored ribosome-binding protein
MVFAEGPFQSVEFLVTVGLLIGALLAGAVVIYVTDVWRKKQVASPREGVESLSMYRSLYERGELSKPEYRVIRDRLAKQLKGEPAALVVAESNGESVGEASGANLDDSPTPPPEAPDKPPPIS